MTEVEEQVKSLIKKAAEANSGPEAMQFAQAALNAANAMLALKTKFD